MKKKKQSDKNYKKLEKIKAFSLTKWTKHDNIVYILCKRQPNHIKNIDEG